MLLHDAVRDGVGQAERQQRGLPAAGRTIPDLLIHIPNLPDLLSDVGASCLAGRRPAPDVAVVVFAALQRSV